MIRRRVAALFVFTTLFALIVIVRPFPVFAVGSAADQMCIDSHCVTDKSKVDKDHPYCETLRCTDTTDKLTTIGYCDTPTHCLATETAEGKAPSPPSNVQVQGSGSAGASPQSTNTKTSESSSGGTTNTGGTVNGSGQVQTGFTPSTQTQSSGSSVSPATSLLEAVMKDLTGSDNTPAPQNTQAEESAAQSAAQKQYEDSVSGFYQTPTTQETEAAKTANENTNAANASANTFQQSDQGTQVTSCDWWCSIKETAANILDKGVEIVQAAGNYIADSIITPVEGGAYSTSVKDSLDDAASIICTAYGCNPTLIAQSLGGVCSQESNCNPDARVVNQYVGVGQLNANETNLALKTLDGLSTNPALSPAQQAQVSGVVSDIKDDLASGDNPNQDAREGAWLLAARQLNMPDIGQNISPIQIADKFASTPQEAANIMQLAQLAPSTMVNFDTSATLTNSQLAALQSNRVDVGRGDTVGDALDAMTQSKIYSSNINQGITWMNPSQAQNNADSIPLPIARPLDAPGGDLVAESFPNRVSPVEMGPALPEPTLEQNLASIQDEPVASLPYKDNGDQPGLSRGLVSSVPSADDLGVTAKPLELSSEELASRIPSAAWIQTTEEAYAAVQSDMTRLALNPLEANPIIPVEQGLSLEAPNPVGSVERGPDLEEPNPVAVVEKGPDLEAPSPTIPVETSSLEAPQPAIIAASNWDTAAYENVDWANINTNNEDDLQAVQDKLLAQRLDDADRQTAAYNAKQQADLVEAVQNQEQSISRSLTVESASIPAPEQTDSEKVAEVVREQQDLQKQEIAGQAPPDTSIVTKPDQSTVLSSLPVGRYNLNADGTLYFEQTKGPLGTPIDTVYALTDQGPVRVFANQNSNASVGDLSDAAQAQVTNSGIAVASSGNVTPVAVSAAGSVQYSIPSYVYDPTTNTYTKTDSGQTATLYGSAENTTAQQTAIDSAARQVAANNDLIARGNQFLSSGSAATADPDTIRSIQTGIDRATIQNQQINSNFANLAAGNGTLNGQVFQKQIAVVTNSENNPGFFAGAMRSLQDWSQQVSTGGALTDLANSYGNTQDLAKTDPLMLQAQANLYASDGIWNAGTNFIKEGVTGPLATTLGAAPNPYTDVMCPTCAADQKAVAAVQTFLNGSGIYAIGESAVGAFVAGRATSLGVDVAADATANIAADTSRGAISINAGEGAGGDVAAQTAPRATTEVTENPSLGAAANDNVPPAVEQKIAVNQSQVSTAPIPEGTANDAAAKFNSVTDQIAQITNSTQSGLSEADFREFANKFDQLNALADKSVQQSVDQAANSGDAAIAKFNQAVADVNKVNGTAPAQTPDQIMQTSEALRGSIDQAAQDAKSLNSAAAPKLTTPEASVSSAPAPSTEYNGDLSGLNLNQIDRINLAQGEADQALAGARNQISGNGTSDIVPNPADRTLDLTSASNPETASVAQQIADAENPVVNSTNWTGRGNPDVIVANNNFPQQSTWSQITDTLTGWKEIAFGTDREAVVGTNALDGSARVEPPIENPAITEAGSPTVTNPAEQGELFNYNEAPVGSKPTISLLTNPPADAQVVRVTAGDVTMRGLVSPADADALAAMKDGVTGAPERISLYQLPDQPAIASAADTKPWYQSAWDNTFGRFFGGSGKASDGAGGTLGGTGGGGDAANTAARGNVNNTFSPSGLGSVSATAQPISGATADASAGGLPWQKMALITAGVSGSYIAGYEAGLWLKGGTTPPGAAGAGAVTGGGIPVVSPPPAPDVKAAPAPEIKTAIPPPGPLTTGDERVNTQKNQNQNFLGSMMGALGQALSKLFGGASSNPSQPSPATTPPPTPNVTTPVASTTQPVVTLIANPRSVQSGATTQLVWSSVGANSCNVTDSKGVVLGQGLSGATSSLPLTASTTVFTAQCATPINVTIYSTTSVMAQ